MASHLEQHPLLEKQENNRSALTLRHGLIIPSAFLTLFGAAVYSYVLTEWTQRKIATDYFPNTTLMQSAHCADHNMSDKGYTDYQQVQRKAASWSMAYHLAEYLPALVIQTVLPSYTDYFGRKFLLILTLLSLCLKGVTITVTIQYLESFWYIVAVNILEGLMGGSYAMFSATFSYVADITRTGNQRSSGIVLLEASFLTASVIASFLSGYFIQTLKLGFYNTALLATCVCTLGLVFMLFVPESLPKHQRTELKSPLTTAKRMFEFYYKEEFQGKRISYLILLLAFLFASLSGTNRSTMETVYFLGQPFCWGPSKLGVFMLARHGAQSFIGLGSVKLLQRCITNESIATISTLSSMVSFIIEGFAQTSTMIYMVPVSGMFSFLVIPMIRSMMSSMTSPDRQGALFASVATIEVISTLLASLTENEVYSFTMSFMNGFVFLIMAFFSFVNTGLLVAYKCTKPPENLDAATGKSVPNIQRILT